MHAIKNNLVTYVPDTVAVPKTAHHFFITICAASGSGGMEVKMKKITY